MTMGPGRRGATARDMKRRSEVTCDDCFFRLQGLCALPGQTPCPTFRAIASGSLAPPRQPQLVPLPYSRVAVSHAA
jgi:hypothetical protein